MECFAIDERGYTGANLLDPDQRFQGAWGGSGTNRVKNKG